MKVLVVAAHPDDEVLGCGGTIAKHAKNGEDVYVLLMTNGVSSRYDSGNLDESRRLKALEKSCEILGVSQFKRLDFPDNALDTVPLLDIAKSIEGAREEWGEPSIVLTHHSGDLNIDHELTRRATLTCFRPQPGSEVAEILAFEIPSSTHWAGGDFRFAFNPNYFEDISGHLETKVEALRAYQEEMREWPHSRSIKAVRALAEYRGSSVGLESAEAFSLERKIIF